MKEFDTTGGSSQDHDPNSDDYDGGGSDSDTTSSSGFSYTPSDYSYRDAVGDEYEGSTRDTSSQSDGKDDSGSSGSSSGGVFGKITETAKDISEDLTSSGGGSPPDRPKNIRDARRRAEQNKDKKSPSKTKPESKKEDKQSTAEKAYDVLASAGDAMAGQADEAVGRSTEKLKQGDIRGAVDELTPEGADKYAGNVGREVAEGDVRGAVDQGLGGVDEAASDYAGGLDVLAGSTDEAAARAYKSAQRGDVAGVADAAAGSTDEATARAVDSARRGDVAGVADNLAGGTDEAASGTVRGVGQAVDAGLGSSDEAFARTFDDERGGGYADPETYRRGVDELAGQADEAFARGNRRLAAGDFAGAGDQYAGGMDEGVAQIEDALIDGWQQRNQLAEEFQRRVRNEDYRGAADTYVKAAGAGYGTAAEVADIAAGGTDEYVGSAEVNTEFTDDLTQSGGFLSEEDERKLRTASQNFSEDAGYIADVGTDYSPVTAVEQGALAGLDEAGVPTSNLRNEKGEGVTERFTEGAVEGILGLGNAFSYASMGETGAEIAGNAPRAVPEAGAAAAVASSTAVGREVVGGAIDSVRKNPARAAGGLTGEFLTGVGVARKIEDVGTAARVASRRARGKREYTPDEFMGDDLAKEYDPGQEASSSEMVSPFRQESGDADMVDTAVRQSRENTPDDLVPAGELRSNEGIMKHASPYYFDDRFEAGIPKTRPEDPDNAMFFSPEAEPYFAGMERGLRSQTGLGSYIPTSPRDLRLPNPLRNKKKNVVLGKMEVDRAPDLPEEAKTMDAPEEPIRDTVERIRRENPDLGEDEIARRAAEENPDYGYSENRGVMQLTQGAESKWLSDEARPGRGYVRGGDNMNLGESEVVVKGGSGFREVSNPGFIRMQGDVLDVRVFEPTDARRTTDAPDAPEARDAPDAPEGSGPDGDVAGQGADAQGPMSGESGGRGGDTYTQRDLYEMDYYGEEPQGTPYVPIAGPGPGAAPRDQEPPGPESRREGRTRRRDTRTEGERPPSEASRGPESDAQRESGDTRQDRSGPDYRRTRDTENPGSTDGQSSRRGQPGDSGSRRVTDNAGRRRVTGSPDGDRASGRPERREDESYGQPSPGPSDRGEPARSPPRGGPGREPPAYPPRNTYGPPMYGAVTPPSGPSEFTGGGGGGGGGGIPRTPYYETGYDYNRIPERETGTDEEPERNRWQMGYFGRGWVNPVATAQQATSALFGDGSDDSSPLDAVREDIENSR